MRLPLALLLLLASPARADEELDEPAPAACPDGRVVDEDTDGHCCWPGQVWSPTGARCIGAPVCPPGQGARGDDCAPGCPPGQIANADTRGHCCWPGQAWSNRRRLCVGAPRCPMMFTPLGETCGPGPPAGDATITFVAATKGDHFTVTVDGRSCATPCDLAVHTGRTVVEVAGARAFKQHITVRPGAQVARIHRSRSWLYTGFIGFAGAFASGVGAFTNGLSSSSHVGVSIVLAVSAAVLAASGLIVLLSGGQTEITLEAAPPLPLRNFDPPRADP